MRTKFNNNYKGNFMMMCYWGFITLLFVILSLITEDLELLIIAIFPSLPFLLHYKEIGGKK